VPGEQGVLDELAGRDHPGELLGIDEMVFDAVGLAWAGRACRATHRHPDVRVTASHRGNHGALADT
jgi:hypothetical protein